MEIREQIKKYAKTNYKDIIKAIISLESPKTDEEKLEAIYNYYMENDQVNLLSDEILESL